MVKVVFIVFGGDCPLFVASSNQECQDHINEALDFEVGDAANWVVRKYREFN